MRWSAITDLLPGLYSSISSPCNEMEGKYPNILLRISYICSRRLRQMFAIIRLDEHATPHHYAFWWVLLEVVLTRLEFVSQNCARFLKLELIKIATSVLILLSQFRQLQINRIGSWKLVNTCLTLKTGKNLTSSTFFYLHAAQHKEDVFSLRNRLRSQPLKVVIA